MCHCSVCDQAQKLELKRYSNNHTETVSKTTDKIEIESVNFRRVNVTSSETEKNHRHCLVSSMIKSVCDKLGQHDAQQGHDTITNITLMCLYITENMFATEVFLMDIRKILAG